MKPISLLLSCLLVFCDRAYATSIPINGPLLPRPSTLSTSTTFQSTIANLTEGLDISLISSASAGFAVQNTPFSVALTSYSQAIDDAVVWDYHHLAPERDPNATNSINGDTQYLIASISKVFTDLLVLKHAEDIRIDDIVTKWLPELQGDEPTSWNVITIGDLMDHLSGIVQNYGFPEIFELIPLYETLGFPALSKDDFPPCNIIGLNGACSEDDLLKKVALSNPVLTPNLSPAYSNLPFTLLGIILSRATNQTFANLIRNDITNALNMTNTGVSPGNTSLAAIPPGGQSSWGSDFGLQTPAGGLFSSSNDLARFAHAILNHQILPTEAQSRAWLKPSSSLSGLNGLSLVGKPWEIYRVDPATILPDHPDRGPIEIYAKDGGVVQYSSRLALVEEYGIGVVCLTAGDINALDVIMEGVMAQVLPSLEEVAREEAKKKYTGNYIDMNQHEGFEVNMTIGIDDGPGLKVLNLDRNGSDILSGIEMIYNSGVVVAGVLEGDWRIYPTQIQHNETLNQGNKSEQVLLEDWRLGFNTARFNKTNDQLKSKMVFQGSVGSWQGLDSMYYGGRPVDRMVFVRNVTDGKVISAQWPALRAEVAKV